MFTLAACWIGAIAFAQVELQVDTIRAVRPLPPHEAYSFPHVRTPQDPSVGERIHRHICIDLLEADPDTAGNDLFSMVWGDTAWPMPRLSIYEWSVGRPLKEVVSIEVVAEGCGAYCEGFTKHYAYDLRNGRYLGYDSLFTPAGLVAVDDTLDKIWRAILQQYIVEQRDSFERGGLSEEDSLRIPEVIELYSSCLGERPPAKPYVSDISPSAHVIRFYIDRCAPHVIRALDELDDVEIHLPYSWLQQWFRPELRALFKAPQ